MLWHQKTFRRLQNRLLTPIRSANAKPITDSYTIASTYKRIYHYHIRKTAGSSLNSAFLSISGAELGDIARRNWFRKGNYVYVHHEKKLIERGDYFYADSHLPAHALSLPNNTFTVTILRDPVERVKSLYTYLVWARDEPNAYKIEPAFDQLRRETRWLGTGFSDFLSNVPREHLLNQLYMFSEHFSVAEAVERIASVSYVAFQSEFGEHIERLSQILGLPLKLSWERRFGEKVVPTAAELEKARALLQPEIEMMQLVASKLRAQGRLVPPAAAEHQGTGSDLRAAQTSTASAP